MEMEEWGLPLQMTSTGMEVLSTDVMNFEFSISYNITVGIIPSASPTTTPAPTQTMQPTQAPTVTLRLLPLPFNLTSILKRRDGE